MDTPELSADDFDIQLDALPDRIQLDNGYYLLKVEDMKVLEPKDDDEHYKLTYLGRFRVEEPEAEKGISHFERYICGSDVDPMCTQETTRRSSRGLNALKRLVTATGLPSSLSLKQACLALREQHVVARARKSVSKKGGEFVNLDEYFSPTSEAIFLVGSAVTKQTKHPAHPVTTNLTPAPGADMITCHECQESIPRGDYGRHAVSHHAH
jgi:hypothetical protein